MLSPRDAARDPLIVAALLAACRRWDAADRLVAMAADLLQL